MDGGNQQTGCGRTVRGGEVKVLGLFPSGNTIHQFLTPVYNSSDSGPSCCLQYLLSALLYCITVTLLLLNGLSVRLNENKL